MKVFATSAFFSKKPPVFTSQRVKSPYCSLADSKQFEEDRYAIPRMRVIDNMVSSIKAQPLPHLESTMIVGVQHMFSSTVPLLDGLVAAGIGADNLYFSGKFYSNSPSIEKEIRHRGIHLISSTKPHKIGVFKKYWREDMRRLWQYFIEDIANKKKKVDRLIIISEGPDILETMPEYLRFKYSTAAVLHTTADLYSESLRRLPFPTVNVAASAAKRQLEAPIIAETALAAIQKIMPALKPHPNSVFGVIGNGAIGSAIVKYLLAQGYMVTIYDESELAFHGIANKNLYRLQSIKEVIDNSQYIFGCTGKDITQNIDILNTVVKDKVFASCSSGDIEMLSLLRQIAANNTIAMDPHANITCQTKNGSNILVLNGGFPLNFIPQSPISAPASDIQLTRGLILGGCWQAISIAKRLVDDGLTVNAPSCQMLNPYIQRYVVRSWKKTQPENRYPAELLDCFYDINWIKNNSANSYQHNNFIERCFSGARPSASAEFPRTINAKKP